ncbi:MAG: VOC family protein [Sulfitobacter sp.]|uniref:VOC family protein n=1 Tax=Sulfitobacter sp. TaxID=1903071 RepID=UPI0040584560
MSAQLEHANFTVSDPEATAAWMTRVFGWRVRWQGPAIAGGHTVHIGNDTQYVALFTPPEGAKAGASSYHTTGGLNHIGIVVNDLKAAEVVVKAQGFTPKNHADYNPGHRFYFHDHDGIEYELVQYDA